MTRLAALFARLGPDPRADAALLRAFLADRDEAAFAELLRRHGPTVWGVCRRALPDPADAEDAFQATFLVLLRRRPTAETLGPWLYRVAVFTSRGLRRKNARRRTQPLPDVPARPDPTPVDVDALLMRLPERERAAVVLCHLHGLTQREAADRLGVAEGTLSARLSRGLAKLRRHGPVGVLTVAVPATVAEATATVATAGRAAGPGVGLLVTEVLRMFLWKKLAKAGLVVAGVIGFGAGLGLSVRSGPAAMAADPPAPAKPQTTPKVDPPPATPPLEAQRVEAVFISAGEPHVFRAKSGRPIVELFVRDVDMVTAVADAKAPSQWLLTGERLGVTAVSVRDDQGDKEGVNLVIDRPRTLRIMLAVGESMPLILPNKQPITNRRVKTPDGMCTFTRDEQPANAPLVVVARAKGNGLIFLTDATGLEWTYHLTVIDPPAKPAKP